MGGLVSAGVIAACVSCLDTADSTITDKGCCAGGCPACCHAVSALRAGSTTSRSCQCWCGLCDTLLGSTREEWAGGVAAGQLANSHASRCRHPVGHGGR